MRIVRHENAVSELATDGVYGLHGEAEKNAGRITRIRYVVGFSVLLFLSAFLYLHQKVVIYVQAYELSKNYQTYNDLVDERDFLMSNFKKEASLPKINQWAADNNLVPVAKERILGLNLRRQSPVTVAQRMTAWINSFVGKRSGSSTALADDNKRQ